MAMATICNIFSVVCLGLLAFQEHQVSAQSGTVQSAIFDYIQNQMNAGVKSPVNPPATPPLFTFNTAPNVSKSNPLEVFVQNAATSVPSVGLSLSSLIGSGSPATDMFSSVKNPTGVSSNNTSYSVGSSPAGSSGIASNPTDFYNELIRIVNQNTPVQSQPAPAASGFGISGQTLTVPAASGFGISGQTLTAPAASGFGISGQTLTAPAASQNQGPKILPFVPAEWNIPKINSQGTAGWSFGTQHQGQSPWQQHNNPNQLTQPPSHPLSSLTMIPRIQNMITTQATQSGDMAYYLQHGCVDPATLKPGPTAASIPLTLTYGCSSPVSEMACKQASIASGGTVSNMASMMTMLNPTMTRTFEKCLSPKILTELMSKGFSGGSGGMDPMMAMAMSSGGGSSGMGPMLMMLLSQQNQAGSTGTGLSSGHGTSSATSSMPGTFPGSSLTQSNNSFTGPPGKQIYKDPSSANTLISQAASIPHLPPANPLQSMFSGMTGMGNGVSQSTSSSNLPLGIGSSGGVSQNHGLGGQAPIDCSSVMPMIMAKVMAAGEGFISPEAEEAVTELRKQYLPYACHEFRLKYTGLPLRLCCPGRVEQPTMFDLFKAQSASAAK